ncbi:MAG: InlB B-repeat-containing protein, partial [Treponema sp.]|nr:InlB B-repeat-containing protein [Treponema sp.]
IKIEIFSTGTSLEKVLQRTGIVAEADSSKDDNITLSGGSAPYTVTAKLYVPGTSNQWTGSRVRYDIYLILGSADYYRLQDGRFYMQSTPNTVYAEDFLKLNPEDGSTLYTLTFSAGSGSGTPPEPLEVAPGTVITVPGQGDMTAPEGRAFAFWNYENRESGFVLGHGSSSEGDEYTVIRNITFVAQWGTGYTVTFSAGSGSGTPPESRKVLYGTAITLPGQGSMIAPDRSDFAGWRGPYYGNIYPEGDSYTVTEDVTFTAQWKPWVPRGVYIGIISFAGGVTAITPAYQPSQNSSTLNHLSQDGQNAFYNRLQNYTRASESGTALYYAVHQALANLTAAEPVFSHDDIQSIHLITFTDGLDNASFGASNANPVEGKSGVTSTEYAAYVKEQIGSRKIGGVPVTAYSIGVKGSDVTDEQAFNTTLSSIASAEENVHTLTNISDLQDTFTEIANSVNSNIAVNFRMVTTQNDPGTVIRMTFDNVESAESSTRYIEGTLAYDNATSKYSLTNIQYSSGIASESGTAIEGVVSGSTVSFTFKEISGYNPQTDTAKQWIKASSSSSWQINSEYDSSGSKDATVDTMFIYLVLDASTSLDSTQVSQIRTAVSSFIGALYDRIY